MNAMTRLSLAVAVAVILLGGVLAVRAVQGESAIDESIHKLEDDDRFTNSTKAGNTIAEISVRLRQEGAKCRESDKQATRCTAVLSAAAYAAVTAYTVLDCTAPGVYDGRTALLKHLRAVRTYLDRGARRALPSVPKVIAC